VSLRVLVVDDHDAWRRQISSTVRNSRGWQIVGEVADGPEAVREAKALNPDLILLDVELPTLNGIEAARQIVVQSPASRILFVSAHRSWDVVEAALDSGGHGYIVKTETDEELMPAMAAVVTGRRYIGSLFTDHFAGVVDCHAVAHLDRHHELCVYCDDGSRLEGYVGFARAALTSDKIAVFAVESERMDVLRERLRSEGPAMSTALDQQQCRLVDMGAAVSDFAIGDSLDEARFWKVANGLVMEVARSSRRALSRIAFCGDGVAMLLRSGRVDAAVRLEHLWDRLCRGLNVQTLCPVSLVEVAQGGSHLMERLRAEHSRTHC
jgi:CheY-like chemotaxis protein